MAKSTVISPRPAGWSRGSRLPLISAVAAVLLGVVLLTLGLPRLVSSLILLPSDPVSDSLRLGRTVNPAAISALQRRSSLARRFSSSGRIAAELGAAKIAEAELLPASAVRERFRLADEAALLLEQ